MRRRTLFYYFLFLSTVFLIFRNWFLHSLIIGGDWPYYYDEFLKNFFLVPTIWQPWLGNGLGGIQPLLGLHLFSSIVIVPFTQWLDIPWNIVYKVGWFGLFLILSFFSPVILWRSVFPRVSSRWPAFLAGLIYSTNTYILMVTGGGQMGVAIAYGIAPLVLASFIRLFNAVSTLRSNAKFQMPNVKLSICAGLMLAFQLMIDPRIAYGTMVGVGMYLLLKLKTQNSKVKATTQNLKQFSLIFLSVFWIPLLVALGFNAFWVLPMVVMRENPLESLGSTYTSIDALKFFSFSDFSHALSLLHPNWPENIFGKTYFLQPEFLIIPLIAFASLFFIKYQTTNNKKQILFFALLAIIGVFLAKGVNEPFGGVYVWLFEHVPGFVMFRDPTKWYVLTALSYSVLIPFTLEQLVIRRKIKTVLITLFILFWLFTIRQAALGQLGGTFVRHSVPQEYRDLERFLRVQPNFARTLWVPRQQRFSYGTLDHMPVEAEPLFGATTAAELKGKLESPISMEFLGDLGIGYVMIPYDSLGELFLQDRKYDEKKRQEYETVLDGVGWLTKIRSGNLAIYQTPRHRDLFWVSTNEPLTYRQIRPDRYAVSFTVREPATVYFSQGYYPGWVFIDGNTRIKSEPSPHELNSFQVLSPGTYDGIVEFEPQKYVVWGMAISLLTVLGVAIAFML